VADLSEFTVAFLLLISELYDFTDVITETEPEPELGILVTP
jgi:hypothetical protein